jgi:hypothetical protein
MQVVGVLFEESKSFIPGQKLFQKQLENASRVFGNLQPPMAVFVVWMELPTALTTLLYVLRNSVVECGSKHTTSLRLP